MQLEPTVVKFARERSRPASFGGVGSAGFVGVRERAGTSVLAIGEGTVLNADLMPAEPIAAETVSETVAEPASEPVSETVDVEEIVELGKLGILTVIYWHED